MPPSTRRSAGSARSPHPGGGSRPGTGRGNDARGRRGRGSHALLLAPPPCRGRPLAASGPEPALPSPPRGRRRRRSRRIRLPRRTRPPAGAVRPHRAARSRSARPRAAPPGSGSGPRPSRPHRKEAFADRAAGRPRSASTQCGARRRERDRRRASTRDPGPSRASRGRPRPRPGAGRRRAGGRPPHRVGHGARAGSPPANTSSGRGCSRRRGRPGGRALPPARRSCRRRARDSLSPVRPREGSRRHRRLHTSRSDPGSPECSPTSVTLASDPSPAVLRRPRGRGRRPSIGRSRGFSRGSGREAFPFAACRQGRATGRTPASSTGLDLR